MADTHALESLAALLPPERRERFFTIASEFRNIREDDDHLQMLEAIGFLLLVMKEIPAEINAILEQAQRTIGEAESEKLRSEVVAVLTESLDMPSYKDLRETVRSMREQEERFRRKVEDIHYRLTESEIVLKSSSSIWPQFINGLTGGLIASVIAGACTWFIIDRSAKTQSRSIPEALKPYAALHERAQLDYFETHLPDFGGDVRMYLIGGDVISAFKEGDHGIVVCRSSKPAN